MTREQIAAAVRDALRQMTADERVAFFEKLCEGYCAACGDAVTRYCYCQNDE